MPFRRGNGVFVTSRTSWYITTCKTAGRMQEVLGFVCLEANLCGPIHGLWLEAGHFGSVQRLEQVAQNGVLRPEVPLVPCELIAPMAGALIGVCSGCVR